MLSTAKSRRSFLVSSTASLGALPFVKISDIPQSQTTDNLNEIGPKQGFTPQVGTLVSMMNWMRGPILSSVKGLSISELDYLHDEKSNTIGAMLLHLAATERYYQLHTFEGMKWGSWDRKIKAEWDTPMDLGEKGRQIIKGHSLDFYLEKLESVRAKSLEELATRNDEWLLSVDKSWFWGPTNNYCKWFHVVEHESNHNGQIKYIKSRIQ